MTRHEIDGFIAQLQQERRVAEDAGERHFDGSPTWERLVRRMTEDVLQETAPASRPEDGAQDAS
jgi:hypothetical protein